MAVLNGRGIAVGRDGQIRIATVRRALGYLRPHRLGLAVALACLIGQALLVLAPYVVVQRLVSALERPNGSLGTIAALTGVGVVLVLLAGLVGVLRSWIVLRINTETIASIRRQLMQRLLGQSVSYFTAERGGELMSRLLNDVSAIETALADSALSLVGGLITAALCVIVMGFVQWQLALVTVAVLPLVAFAIGRSGRPVYRTRRDLQERLAAFTVHAQEVLSLSGIMLVKSFGRETDEHDRSTRLIEDVQRSGVHAGMTARWIGLGFQLLQSVAPLTLILAGGWLIERHQTSLGTVIAFVTVLALRFGASLVALGNAAVRFLGALPAWDRVLAVLDAEPTIGEPHRGRAPARTTGAIRFEDVGYTYQGQARPAIDGVSLDVAAGQLVALVGPSGGGKSTLASLLARFYDPDQGSVMIDGRDLRELPRAAIADSIGLVLQDTYLFHGTLRDNLRYASPGADETALRAACLDAHLDTVIEDLPDGLDTMVGERGHRLSGGEKQRVAIARVILKDAPILILDEATSHLDTASERLVQAALARLFAGRTSFVIAHRLSTVLAANLIVVLDRGRIVERGSHDELLEAGGVYAGLHELQFGRHEHRPALALSR